jgi:hypothetical protein
MLRVRVKVAIDGCSQVSSTMRAGIAVGIIFMSMVVVVSPEVRAQQTKTPAATDSSVSPQGTAGNPDPQRSADGVAMVEPVKRVAPAVPSLSGKSPTKTVSKSSSKGSTVAKSQRSKRTAGTSEKTKRH